MRRCVRGRARRALAAALLGLLLAGCATFPDDGPRDWREKLEGGGELGGPPSVPDPDAPDLPGPPGATPPGQGGQAQPQGCVDPDPQVVATCLNPVGAIAVLPDGDAALVGERTTGRVLRVERGAEPRLVATVPVDAAGGGGLTGLVLSPAYSEDRLVYAYATTPAGNQVLRIAAGEPPKPVLTGIPRGPSNNGGALAVDRTGALLVATGDAGAPPDLASLAGKVLRIDTLGRPATGNPDPASPVYSSGLMTPGGLCVDLRRGTTWVTDRRPDRDALQIVEPGPLLAPEWEWTGRPQVGGCVAQDDLIGVAQTDLRSVFVLRTIAGRTFAGTPEIQLDGTYGRLSAVSPGPDRTVWLGTVNKAGGSPVSSDDRVIRVQLAGGSSAGNQA
ncbi:MAG: PQQ-dependent sugar dehydrogenase [Pseudonocardia sp.]